MRRRFVIMFTLCLGFATAVCSDPTTVALPTDEQDKEEPQDPDNTADIVPNVPYAR